MGRNKRQWICDDAGGVVMTTDDTRPFRIQQEWNWGKPKDHRPMIHNHATCIPWWLAEEAYKYYSEKHGTDQSLERLNERGGFGREELLNYLRRGVK